MTGNMDKAKKINGKSIADEIRRETADQVAKLGINPCLAVILVGSDPASQLYVSLKKKAAENCGIQMSLYNFEENAQESEIIETIEFLNNDKKIDAILVQLPLPSHLDEDKVISTINPKKDIDGFGPNTTDIMPPLNMGIMQLIASTGENLQGKNAVIAARSRQFTQSLSKILNDFGVKATTVNPDDENAKHALKNADIIISAAGKPKWITQDNIKDGATLIDVGTTRINGKTAGDVHFESCARKAEWITPVPGGVGPMTVAMLMKNTVALCARENY